MTKVLIADDHPLFRHGLKQLLFSVSAAWRVDEAGNGQEILDRVWREDYDLIFLDIALPQRPGNFGRDHARQTGDAGFDLEHALRRSIRHASHQSRRRRLPQQGL